jgi:dihydroflavonol-4-reductase
MEAARRVFCVTGGTGFLGVAVVRILLSKGHRVRVIVRTADHVLAATPGIEMHLGSINDEPFMERVCEGAHGIFHLAGIVEHSRSSTANVYRINVDGTRSVMRAAAKHGLKVVFTSTSGTVAVSRRPEVRGDADGYARGVIDNWPYYDSKREGEEVARRIAAERGVRLVILRPTSIAGPGEASLPAAKSLEYYRHKSVYKHLARKVPYVPGGGLSLCDVRDVAEAHCRAMETPAADGGAFCLGGRPDANMTLKAFFDLLEQLSGVPRTRLEAPPPSRALHKWLCGRISHASRSRCRSLC